MMISAVTLWMTEIAPPAVRGVFVSLVGASLLLGYSASAWVGFGFYHLDSPHAWRAPFGEIDIVCDIVLAHAND